MKLKKRMDRNKFRGKLEEGERWTEGKEIYLKKESEEEG